MVQLPRSYKQVRPFVSQDSQLKDRQYIPWEVESRNANLEDVNLPRVDRTRESTSQVNSAIQIGIESYIIIILSAYYSPEKTNDKKRTGSDSKIINLGWDDRTLRRNTDSCHSIGLGGNVQLETSFHRWARELLVEYVEGFIDVEWWKSDGFVKAEIIEFGDSCHDLQDSMSIQSDDSIARLTCNCFLDEPKLSLLEGTEGGRNRLGCCRTGNIGCLDGEANSPNSAEGSVR
jgi:hypothetical protein